MSYLSMKVHERYVSIGVVPEGYLFDAADQEAAKSSLRGRVEGMSRDARSRLFVHLLTAKAEFVSLATLTVPSGVRLSPDAWRAAVRAMLVWMRSNMQAHDLSRPQSIVWVKEFTAAGAPHLHCLLTGYIEKDALSSAWARLWVCAAGETGGIPLDELSRAGERVRAAGTRIEAIRGSYAAGRYISKYLGKEAQKQAPDWFRCSGRWWGVVGDRQRVPAVSVSDRNDVARARVGASEHGPLGKFWLEITRITAENANRADVRTWSNGVGLFIYRKVEDKSSWNSITGQCLSAYSAYLPMPY